MAKIVLIPSLVAAKNIDSLNQSFLDSSNDYDNGMVFKAGAYDSAKQTYTLLLSEVVNYTMYIWHLVQKIQL